mmetsp:Transcript_35308/g.59516  ORF Transcript_35308/g.59516 Transcript_35308/m.59516 type:complete len:207 (-) Transcript_35308:259-879(-)|eukprot:CAMPEP_0198209722 /NCGR_PEP_ID=MMETSP1445-20131203/17691_1 /TAXON_ID=36898 /ORGANISM="Pyramimonas sp., Strain CCMP2087" /LENGTH=206 /DNA_ID=CAMNT_0043883587 /DNA_START=480 /DNA_END=1100 /DNA_ORIENTATION=-
MPKIVNSGTLGWYAEDWFQKRGKNLLPRLTPKMDEDITTCFHIFDEDDSGTVGKEEVRQTMAMLAICYTDKQLDELYGEFDANGDQEFDICEFKMLMARQMYSGSNNRKGPEGGDPCKSTKKVDDIKTSKLTLQRRNILGKVFTCEPGTMKMLCTLNESGLKKVQSTSRERLLAPPKVPVPFQHRSRRRINAGSINAFTHGVSSDE